MLKSKECDIAILFGNPSTPVLYILSNENQNLNEIISCNMYGYNIDAPPISTTMGVGMILFLVL